MKNRKRLIYISLGIILLVVIFVMLSTGQGVAVDTVSAQKMTLTVKIRGEGQTRVTESYMIMAPVSGQVSRIVLDVGDPVANGDELVQVLPVQDSAQSKEVAQSNLQAARARLVQASRLLEDARAIAEQAETEYQRQKSLAEQEIISEQMLDQASLQASSARRQFEAAGATAQAAAADVRAAEAMLVTDDEDRDSSGLVVTSPIDGHVLAIVEKSARVVMAGEPLLEVGDTANLELIVDVLSEDAVRIEAGARVDIDGWGGDRTLSGTVRRVEPSAFTKYSALGVEEQRVNVIIDFEERPASLGSGFRAEAGIVVWEESDIVTVPVNAIFQSDGAWYVFVVEEDAAVMRAIEIGERSSDSVQVVSGVDEGEEIVQFPSADVDDGVAIRR